MTKHATTAPASGASLSDTTTPRLDREMVESTASAAIARLQGARLLIQATSDREAGAADALHAVLDDITARLERLNSAAMQSAEQPTLSAVPAPSSTPSLMDAQRACDDVVIQAARVDAVLHSAATGDGSLEDTVECIGVARELMRPLRQDARNALDIVTDARRGSG